MRTPLLLSSLIALGVPEPAATAPIDRFMAAYEPALYEALKKHPDDYAYGPAEVPALLPVWRKALLAGNFNHHGWAMKSACKRLGIKHTLKAITAFLNNHA